MAESIIYPIGSVNYSNNYVVERYTTARATIKQVGSSEVNLTWTVTKSGYFPIGIVGISNYNNGGSGESNVNHRRFRLINCVDGQCTLDYYGGSYGSQSSISFQVEILWEKL